jgi:hypothetical protein
MPRPLTAKTRLPSWSRLARTQSSQRMQRLRSRMHVRVGGVHRPARKALREARLQHAAVVGDRLQLAGPGGLAAGADMVALDEQHLQHGDAQRADVLGLALHLMPAAAGAVQADTSRPSARTTQTRQLPWGAKPGLWHRCGI